MNPPTTPPAPDPDDANHQSPPIGNAVHGFPPPLNPHVIISQLDAIQRALLEAGRYGENNPEVIRSRVMSYQDALQLMPESTSVAEDDELANTPVLLVEMAGAFKIRSRPRRVAAPTQPFTKAHIILRAADGLALGSCIFTE